MKQYLRLLSRSLSAAVVFMLMAVATGCVTKTAVPALQAEPEAVSAVSVVHAGFAFEAGQTVGWRTEMLWLGDDVQHQYRQVLTDLNIKQEIENQLTQDGMRFVSPAEADYVLVAAVVIGDTADGTALAELTRLYPSLGAVARAQEKGTLLVAMSHPGSPVILWRGSVQTHLADVATPDQRERRLQSVVHSLVVTVPKASGQIK